jgi:uncharacterized membrane protein
VREYFTFLALMAINFAAIADQLNIDADRPGFLFAVSTVPVGHLQLEFGTPD